MLARSEALIARLSPARRANATPTVALEARLAELVRRAQEGGSFDVGEDAFLAHVAEHLPDDGDLDERLDGLCAADLYLACACCRGDARAFARMRDQTRSAIRAAAATVLHGDAIDEVAQDTMEKLLVGRGGKSPGIALYAGRGRLAKWAQTVALREAQSRARRRAPVAVEDVADLADRVLGGDVDAEIEALKKTYRRQFKAAFADAVGTLAPRERNLLRLEVIDGLAVDGIAAIHGVHAATVFRWRADLRDKLARRTRRYFVDELRMTGDEFQSVMRLVESQLDVSLPRLLREEP